MGDGGLDVFLGLGNVLGNKHTFGASGGHRTCTRHPARRWGFWMHLTAVKAADDLGSGLALASLNAGGYHV